MSFAKTKQIDHLLDDVAYPNLRERFRSYYTETADGCWEWNGPRTNTGYGRLLVGARESYGAHRVAWAFAHGVATPVDSMVCHRCDNPPCVRPDHLFLGSSLDNVLDKVAKGRLHCGNGEYKGSGHPCSKLKDWQVIQIRLSDEPLSVLAARFNISTSNAHLVRRGLVWTHVPLLGADKKPRIRRTMTDQQIERAYLATDVTQQALADEYGVSRAFISDIQRKRRMRSVTKLIDERLSGGGDQHG